MLFYLPIVGNKSKNEIRKSRYGYMFGILYLLKVFPADDLTKSKGLIPLPSDRKKCKLYRF